MPEHVFAGTDMGVYRWDEAPARWVALPSPMTDVWALAPKAAAEADQLSNSRLISGPPESGVAVTVRRS